MRRSRAGSVLRFMLFLIGAAACLVVGRVTVAVAADAAAAPSRMVITAGVPKGFAPHYVIGEDGEVTGFAVEMMNEVARRAGIEVRYRVFDTWVAASAALQQGRVDLIPNMGITDERRQWALFSEPYEFLRVSLFIRVGDQPIEALTDLRKRRMGAVVTNVAEEIIPDLTDIEPVSYFGIRSALDGLLNGEVDVLAYPEYAVRHQVQELRVAGAIARTGLSLGDVMRGIGVRKDRAELLAVLEPHLHAFTRTIEFDNLYHRWFHPELAESTQPWYRPVAGALCLVGLVLVIWIFVRSMTANNVDPEHRQLRKRLWKRVVLTVTSLMAIVFAIVVVALLRLYNVAFEEARFELNERATAEVDLIEAMARFGREIQKDPVSGRAAALRQLRDAFGYAAGETESLLAERLGQHLSFLLRGNAAQKFQPLQIPFGSDLAEPMQRALSGQSGTIVAADYRGELVLAAYRPLAALGLGYVIKKDIADISAPFIDASLAVVLATIALTLLGTVAYLRLITPVVLQALHSEGQFHVLHRATDSGVMGFRPLKDGKDFVIVAVNPAGEMIERAGREQMIGRRVTEHFSDLGKTCLLEALRAVWQTGESEYLPPQQFLTEGGRTWRAYHLYRVPSGEIIAVYNDVSKREDAQAALRASEEKFRQIAENIREVFWMSDPDRHELLYVSPAYEKVWGRSAEELKTDPSSFINAIHPDDRQRVMEAVRKQMEEPCDEEYRIVRPDGTVRWIHGRSNPVLDQSGRVYRIVGIADDITEEKEREGRLLQAQKLESIGRLTGGVAHDFNNLLLVISGNTDLIREKLHNDPETIELVDRVAEAARRAAGLIERMLTFARQNSLTPTEFEVNASIARMEPLLRPILGEDIEIDILPSPRPAPVVTDEAKFEAGIVNLAANARDAMPNGGRLTIETTIVDLDERCLETQAELEPGHYAVIAVADTGTGIPPDVLGHVFEPFFTTKEPGKGTGLGLPMLYGFAKKSGGHASVYSEVGIGTTVRLYLPLHAAAEQGLRPEATAPEHDIAGGDETILVVEDDDLVRQYVTTPLAALGYEVIEASNGAEALSLIEANPRIGLLFTDVVMPGDMSGPALAARARERRPGLRVLFTTGYAGRAGKGRLDLESADVLTKPYGPKDLALAVRRSLAA